MLIGLTGHAGAGKDSVAAVLCAGGWHSIAFADALRFEVAEVWRLDPGLLSDRRHKEQPTPALMAAAAENAAWLRWCAINGTSLIEPRSPRWVMQQWGSFRRQADPLHWVRQVEYWVQYQRQKHGHRRLVVTDVRLANEVAALRRLDGRIVRVHRPDLPALPPETAGHESELHTQIDADGDIHNDGPLQALSAEVWRVVLRLAHTDQAA